MQTSTSIENISKAIVALNAELSNPKNTADNPFFKSKYAPLNEILAEVRPLLSKHGLAIIQNTMSIEDKIGIQTTLLHSSGESISSDFLLLKADKETAQGQGSAITYGRRYQVSAMLSIASEDDDDGNAASGNKPKSATPPALKGEKPKGNQAEFLAKLSKSTTEAHITAALKVQDKYAWTMAELIEQTNTITSLRKSWGTTA